MYDLQSNEIVIAGRMDRISKLLLVESEKLVATIRTKDAKFIIPGLVDLSDLYEKSDTVPGIILEAIQESLLKLALQMAHDNTKQKSLDNVKELI